MLFLQTFLSIVFSLGFFMLLFIIIGYVAFPVLAILFALWFVQFLRGKPMLFRFNSSRFVQKEKKPESDEKIIDVDYTELP